MSPDLLISQVFFAHVNSQNDFLFKVSTGETKPLSGVKRFDKKNK